MVYRKDRLGFDLAHRPRGRPALGFVSLRQLLKAGFGERIGSGGQLPDEPDPLFDKFIHGRITLSRKNKFSLFHEARQRGRKLWITSASKALEIVASLFLKPCAANELVPAMNADDPRKGLTTAAQNAGTV
jgi:hypothetical protein